MNRDKFNSLVDKKSSSWLKEAKLRKKRRDKQTMKTIIRFILAILIIVVAFVVIVGLCWLLGIAANKVGFMPYLIYDGDFWDIVGNGMLTLMMISLGLCALILVAALADELK